MSSFSPKNHAKSCGGHCLLGVLVRGLIRVMAFGHYPGTTVLRNYSE